MSNLFFIKAGSIARVKTQNGAFVWRELNPTTERFHLSQDELVFALENSDWPTMMRCITKCGIGFIDAGHLKDVNRDK